MAGREHAAECREDDVEGFVVEGEGLGVAFHPVDLDIGGDGAGAGGPEERGGEIDAGYPGALPGGRNRRVAGTARDVEHVLLRTNAYTRDEPLAYAPDPLRDEVVVTGRPHRLAVLLEGRDVHTTLLSPKERSVVLSRRAYDRSC